MTHNKRLHGDGSPAARRRLSRDVSAQKNLCMNRLVLAFLITQFSVSYVLAQEQKSATDARPALLQSLDGQWVMTGDVMGKSVTYDMEAVPTLHGTFTEMHMKDVQVPSEYEARVFIGYDAESHVIIAHWLDNFGAKYSIPHGTGKVFDNSIQFTIPYADGPFRDTLTYSPGNRTWSFVIEASQPDGTWTHFARYEIRRK